MNGMGNASYARDVAEAARSNVPWEELRGRTVLITGATGLICSCAADVLLWLNRNSDMGIQIILAGRSRERTAGRFAPFEEERDYRFTRFDATSGELPNPASAQIDYIIHGASNAHPAAYTQQPVETMLANFLGLHAMLRLAGDRGSRRLLYISSSEVYGETQNNRPYSETDFGYVDLQNPRACYPCSKRAAETLCAAYSAEYGVETVVVRPGHIYGPTMTDSDSRAAAQFARNALRGENIVMKSAGTQLRSYCYVTDCVTAIFTALLKGKSGEAYNISNPDSICTIRELAEAFSNAGGGEVVYTQAAPKERSGFNLMSNSSLASTKIEALGWKAAVSLESGAQRTVKGLMSDEDNRERTLSGGH